MFARSRALAVVCLLAGGSLAAACTAETADEEGTTQGDGSSSEDALTSEHQLTGSELPANTIALTFDDGPGGRTIELADWLADRNIHATFFINGKNVPGHQLAPAHVVARGHILANHTQNHVQITKQSGTTLYHAVADTDVYVKQQQPNGPFLFRAPFGAWNGRVSRELNGTDMKKYVGSVFWDMGGELTSNTAADWDCWGHHMSVESCGDLYMQEIQRKKHGIVLMHDIHDKTVDMVKLIVPKLQADGFKFATLLEVPSIKRALGAAMDPTQPAGASTCYSSTLGKNVEANACVQSRSNSAWFRCQDGEWAASSPTDPKCASKHPL